MVTRKVGEMLVSAERGRRVKINAAKVSRGSYFTTNQAWMVKPVREFLVRALASSGNKVLDPFAGDGHLLETVAAAFGSETFGYDIVGRKWRKNDSLISIANPERAVIVTNPPYLANHSATRKGVATLVSQYFESSQRDNLYKIALDKCLEAADYVIAIVPETFLLATYPKHRLVLVSVIESDLFSDTAAPAVVACFAPRTSRANVFIGAEPVGLLNQLLDLRKTDRRKDGKYKLMFNVPSGRIGLRAVDSADGKNSIAFMPSSEFFYKSGKVVGSSRLMTYIEIPGLSDAKIEKTIKTANARLARIREQSQDLVLAPFKGNTKTGKRRRRLDYALARQLLLDSIPEARKAGNK